ncbi:hypothetical protein ABVK25_002997 [Lepraria finkii]|uniref:Uncharacterized protein n=1 Tax=Lepraria finkii TaxID=1340010 RepID=A0ABR4BKX2_9LECA
MRNSPRVVGAIELPYCRGEDLVGQSQFSCKCFQLHQNIHFVILRPPHFMQTDIWGDQSRLVIFVHELVDGLSSQPKREEIMQDTFEARRSSIGLILWEGIYNVLLSCFQLSSSFRNPSLVTP